MIKRFKAWIASHHTYTDGPRMVRYWWGPWDEFQEGWQAEFFTPRKHRLFWFIQWTTWEDCERGSILEAIFGRYDHSK